MQESSDNSYKEYFISQTDIDTIVENTNKFNKNYIPCNRTDNYPIPIAIRRSNKRVLSQNGYFMAYNLNSMPHNYPNGNNFNYLDLKNIQIEYENLLRSKNCAVQRFLDEIRIHPKSVGVINSDLKTLGISKSHVYPELKNIFGEAKAELKELYKN